MSTCPSCGRDYRVGVMVVLLDPDDNMTSIPRRRVCQGCANKGIVVVAPRKAPTVKEVVGKEDVVEFARKAVRQIESMAKMTRAALSTSPSNLQQAGRLEGLESAVIVIKRLAGIE